MNSYKDLDCILLIDDDDTTNFINEHIIKRCQLNCHVQICDGAQKGLDFLMSEGQYAEESLPLPGIIFLDINMPGMDGWEFLEEYNKLPEDRKARVVVTMLTTSSNPSDFEKAKSMPGVKSFLNKPLEVEQLMSIVKDHFKEI